MIRARSSVYPRELRRSRRRADEQEGRRLSLPIVGLGRQAPPVDVGERIAPSHGARHQGADIVGTARPIRADAGEMDSSLRGFLPTGAGPLTDA